MVRTTGETGLRRNEAIAVRFEQLTEETTLHGLPQLKRSNSRLKRTFWMLIMIVVGIVMFIHITILVISFVKKEINVEIKIESARELSFPAVTFCNSNPVKRSALIEAAKDDPLLQPLLELETRPTDNIETLNTTIQSESYEDVQINGVDESFQREEEITRLLADLPEEQRRKIGFQANEMLIQCRYDGRYCNMTRDFRQFYNVFHGNCYTFNSAEMGLARKTSTRTGRRYGLELAVNINQKDYSRAAGELAAVLLLVHSPDVMPFPEDDGIMLFPGIFSIVGLRLNKIKRAEPPIGECMKSDLNTSSINVYEELHPVKYSKKACLKTCYQQHLIWNCNCAIPYFPRRGKAFGDVIVPLCSTDPESEQKACMDKLNKEFADNTLTCDCPSICNEDIYLSSISTAQWPIVTAADDVISELIYYNPDMFEEPENNTDPDYKEKIVANNFLKVVVFYEDLNHEMVTEFRAYTEIKFLSDMGGTMGLWMGVSVLTMMEIIEFAATVIYYCFTKSNKPPPEEISSNDNYNEWQPKQTLQSYGFELYTPPAVSNNHVTPDQ